MSIPLLFEDGDIVVCVKPVGVSSEDGGLPSLLAGQTGCPRIFCVHRLDTAVSGVMVYAKSGKAAAALSAQMNAGGFEKLYLAAASGVPESSAGIMRDLLFKDSRRNKVFVVRRERRGVRQAELEYAVLGTAKTEYGDLSLLRIRLHTGRSHQIRVQLASRGMPIPGDGKYGSRIKCPIALFSSEIAFTHPKTAERVRFSAKAPDIFPFSEFDL